jgi:hypothetical protein
MKLVLDLPDWVDERNIRILAGIELVASKKHNENFWKVKDERCVQCGECCIGIKGHIYPTVDKACIHLAEEQNGKRACKIALYRSRTCEADPKKCDYITYKIIQCE